MAAAPARSRSSAWLWNSRGGRFVQRHGRRAPIMALWAAVRTLYRREQVRRLVRPLYSPRRPQQWLFVVGCYNSGTTLLQDLIAAHPDVRTLPWEGALITSVLPNPEEVGWTRMWTQCLDYMQMPKHGSEPLVEQLLRDWAPWWGRDGTTFLEKSITNATRMKWLDDNLAPARFIGIVRNGYCVADGIRRKAFPRDDVAPELGGVYPVRMTAAQWVAANEMVTDAANTVEHYHQLHYEDLVRDPVSTLREIWDFAGLSQPNMVSRGTSLVVNGTSFSVSDSMNEKSIGGLSAEEIAQITPIIASLQTRFGYELIG